MAQLVCPISKISECKNAQGKQWWRDTYDLHIRRPFNELAATLSPDGKRAREKCRVFFFCYCCCCYCYLYGCECVSANVSVSVCSSTDCIMVCFLYYFIYVQCVQCYWREIFYFIQWVFDCFRCVLAVVFVYCTVEFFSLLLLLNSVTF